MKKILYGLIVVALVLSLVGCTTPTATQSATEVPVATKVTTVTEAVAATGAAAKTKKPS
jgi:predicted small lipoprotein YifL